MLNIKKQKEWAAGGKMRWYLEEVALLNNQTAFAIFNMRKLIMLKTY
jgi:hypothetical protein